MECAHDELEFACQASGEKSGECTVAVQVRCITCHTQFHWYGVDSGPPSPLGPTCSADGYELRAPIRAGPGAVIQLMQATGMIDRLVNPDV